jgi:hypothetical protein
MYVACALKTKAKPYLARHGREIGSHGAALRDRTAHYTDDGVTA